MNIKKKLSTHCNLGGSHCTTRIARASVSGFRAYDETTAERANPS